MRTFFRYIIIAGLLISCSTPQEKKSATINNPANKNAYASYFKIYQENGFSVLTTYLNAEKTDSVNYVIYSQQKPDISFPAYFIQAPVVRVASLSSVFIGILNNIHELKTVAAVDNANYIANIQITDACNAGGIVQIAKSGQLELEQTLLCKPQLILCNPGIDKKSTFDERLLKANIIPVVCADYYETHPLARAEWIKAISLLFGKEKLADSLFEQIKSNYMHMKESVTSYKNKPAVFTELKTGDTWFVSGNKSYIATLIKDAGANYVFDYIDSPRAQSLTMEQVTEKAVDADYWINLHACQSKEDMLKLDTRYANFKAFKLGNLYNNNAKVNANGASTFWEEGLNHPDELLHDLVSIFHSSAKDTIHLVYYRQLK